MARVWPDVNVEESSLRFHVMSLRKALGDGKDGARYIMTLRRAWLLLRRPPRASKQPAREDGGRSRQFLPRQPSRSPRPYRGP